MMLSITTDARDIYTTGFPRERWGAGAARCGASFDGRARPGSHRDNANCHVCLRHLVGSLAEIPVITIKVIIASETTLRSDLTRGFHTADNALNISHSRLEPRSYREAKQQSGKI